jgi:hypothetical protein
MTEYLLPAAPLPRFPEIPVKNSFQGALKFAPPPKNGIFPEMVKISRFRDAGVCIHRGPEQCKQLLRMPLTKTCHGA